jgi:hypothetical protein
MQLLLASLATALLLAAATFAQMRIPRFTAAGRVWPARVVLIATGIGLAAVTSYFYEGNLPAMLVLLSAFGLAHVPAALILLLKGARHEGRT